jgi:hypothetical protein
MNLTDDKLDKIEYKSRLKRSFGFFVLFYLGIALFVSDNGNVLDVLGLSCAAYGFYQFSRAMPLSYMISTLMKKLS